MGVWRHLDDLGGYSVRPFMSEDDIEEFDADNPAHRAKLAASLPEPGAHAWRIATHFDSPMEFADLFALFCDVVDTTQVRAMVIGYWDTDILSDSPGAVGVLLPHAARFPALRHLFVGDIVAEEHEISWIPPEDVTPLLGAFPLLEEFGYRFGDFDRSGSAPVLRPTRHAHLRSLKLQTGGMPASVPRAVGASDFPALRSLDLWLGVQAYGGDATLADLADVLSGARHPELLHLGLMNSEIQDEVAAAVSGAPVVARLRSLDLSMGTLSDTGAEALLAGQPLTHLEDLSLRHHFLSEDTRARLRAALEPAGVAVDLGDACRPWDGAATPAEGRYTEVAE